MKVKETKHYYFLEQSFYSNGKLLLTGEYLVLEGARALALPTKYGQSLIVKKGNSAKITWQSFDCDSSCWFITTITFEEIIANISSITSKEKSTLIEILHQAYLLNPNFIRKEKGYHIETKLTFPRLWGLGTSSTLINSIAQWTNVNAFKLLENSFGGSGYDIACAQNNTPILYQIIDKKPIVTPIFFHPKFSMNIYFVYLNKKQSSKTAIASYYKKRNDTTNLQISINAITQQLIEANDIEAFSTAIEHHETIIGTLLERKSIKDELFSDFKGSIKSLGAWGGDFIMVVSRDNPKNYFKELGYTTILNYKDIILA